MSAIRTIGVYLTYLKLPPHLKKIYFGYKDREFNLLDVGCGWNGSTKVLAHFKRCNYYGVDHGTFRSDSSSYKLMRKFYDLDLEFDGLGEVPDSFFDVIVMSHVIEHLHNGLAVVRELTSKLKPGGVIYIEFPSLRSLSLPSVKKGCLHFHDDPTHVKLYMTHEVVNALLEGNLKIVRAARRRDGVRMVLAPAMLAWELARGGAWSRAVWDWCGFAEYVFAKKPVNGFTCAGEV